MTIEQQRCHQHCNVPVMCIHNTQHMTGDGQWPGAGGEKFSENQLSLELDRQQWPAQTGHWSPV